MKLNVKVLRYLSPEDFRVLTAVEMGMKNHEVVPTDMIINIASLRHGGVHKIVGELARHNLIARVKNIKYDGYRLTYGGYDYLALKAFCKRGSVFSVGQQIGVGKESDIYVVADQEGHPYVLKIQRLGRVSFRTIKNKRDYLQKRKSASWMYMSRLAAMKEYAFMKVLHEHGFPVPRPIDVSRHCVVMERVEGYPLNSVDTVDHPGRLYSRLMDLIVRLAQHGLIHGDFNEFNIMLTHEGEVVLIDFPQMVSTTHVNAEFYFNRDVDCIRSFFKKRFHYESALFPRFKLDLEQRQFDLDAMVYASGFLNTKQRQDLQELTQHQLDHTEEANEGEANEGEANEEEESEEEESEEEEENDEVFITDSDSESEDVEKKEFEEEKVVEEELELLQGSIPPTTSMALKDDNTDNPLEAVQEGLASVQVDCGLDLDPLEELGNTQRIPFHDHHVSAAVGSQPDEVKPTLVQDEIRKRVQQHLKQRSKPVHRKRENKGKEQRYAREAVRQGDGGW